MHNYLKTSLLTIQFVALTFFLLGSYIHAQTSNHYRLGIEFGLPIQNYFDGGEIIDTFYLNNIGRRSYSNGWALGVASDVLAIFHSKPSIGVSYALSEKNEVRLIAQRIYSWHYGYCYRCLPVGHIIFRASWIPHLLWSHQLLVKRGLSLSSIVGCSYRRGEEHEIAFYGVFDQLDHEVFLRDFGLVGGLSLHREVSNGRIRLAASLLYSEFVHRYDRGQFTNYSWDNGSTRRMLTAMFSIGYRLVDMKPVRYGP